MSRKRSSPNVEVVITPDAYASAKESDSGGCLIADALKRMGYTSPRADVATIRFTDREAGMRYTYLTPESAQGLLLHFDQGWPPATDRFILTRAVRMHPITTARTDTAQRKRRRAELEAKQADGIELTREEKRVLTVAQKTPDRPHTEGKTSVDSYGTVIGGKSGRVKDTTEKNPNLLAGRKRIFGAHTAEPSKAFQAAVDEAIAKRDQETLA